MQEKDNNKKKEWKCNGISNKKVIGVMLHWQVRIHRYTGLFSLLLFLFCVMRLYPIGIHVLNNMNQVFYFHRTCLPRGMFTAGPPTTTCD